MAIGSFNTGNDQYDRYLAAGGEGGGVPQQPVPVAPQVAPAPVAAPTPVAAPAPMMPAAQQATARIGGSGGFAPRPMLQRPPTLQPAPPGQGQIYGELDPETKIGGGMQKPDILPTGQGIGIGYGPNGKLRKTVNGQVVPMTQDEIQNFMNPVGRGIVGMPTDKWGNNVMKQVDPYMPQQRPPMVAQEQPVGIASPFITTLNPNRPSVMPQRPPMLGGIVGTETTTRVGGNNTMTYIDQFGKPVPMTNTSGAGTLQLPAQGVPAPMTPPAVAPALSSPVMGAGQPPPDYTKLRTWQNQGRRRMARPAQPVQPTTIPKLGM